MPEVVDSCLLLCSCCLLIQPRVHLQSLQFSLGAAPLLAAFCCHSALLMFCEGRSRLRALAAGRRARRQSPGLSSRFVGVTAAGTQRRRDAEVGLVAEAFGSSARGWQEDYPSIRAFVCQAIVCYD